MSCGPVKLPEGQGLPEDGQGVGAGQGDSGGTGGPVLQQLFKFKF